MAIYNQIQERGLNAVIQRRLNMTGDAPAPALVPELGAQLVLENDRPEYRRWKEERFFSMFIDIAAVAGEFGSAWVLPVANAVMVITQIRVEGDTVNFGWRTTQPVWSGPTGIGNGYIRDNAFGSQPFTGWLDGTSVALIAFDNAGAARFDRLTSGQTIEYPIILWPDQGKPRLLIRGVTASTQLRANVRGYVRMLTPNELG